MVVMAQIIATMIVGVFQVIVALVPVVERKMRKYVPPNVLPHGVSIHLEV